MAVAEHLHLDMARALDIFFDQHMGVAEGRSRFALAGEKRVGEVGGPFDQPHPLAAAARHRLDEHGVADRGGLIRQMIGILIVAKIAGRHRHACIGHQRLGRVLEPHGGDAGGIGPDPDEPGVDHRLRELRIFRQEAIAGMDRLRARVARRGDDAIAQQIAVADGRGADAHGVVRHGDMQRLCIGVGIDCHGADAEPPRGADDAASDFAAIGDEEGGKHGQDSSLKIMASAPR